MRYHGSFHTRVPVFQLKGEAGTKQQHSLVVLFSRVIEGGVSGEGGGGHVHCVRTVRLCVWSEGGGGVAGGGGGVGVHNLVN